MKICFFIDTMTCGGAERVIANLSNYLVKLNYDVTILTLLDRECAYSLDDKVIYKSLKIKEGKKSLYKKVISIFDNVKLLSKYLKDNKPDIVISFLPRASYYSAIACKKNKTKLIISERNDPKAIYNTYLKKVLTKFLYAKANFMVFQTEEAKMFFQKSIRNKSIIIPNPVNDLFLTNIYEGIRKKKIVTVGRLTEQKNQILLINSFDKFVKNHSDFELYIYGEGPLREKLENEIENLSLSNKVFLPGVSNNIMDCIIDASMFVLSSNYEGMPNALMEALALGVPSISTDCPCGGPFELITNNENGILIPINDVENLVLAMNKLAENQNLQEKFSKNSSSKMKNYSVDKINARWLKIIKEITKNV